MNKLVFKQSLIIPAIGGESGYVSAGVIDNLQSTSPTDALSANQGRVLRLMYESLRDRVAPILDDSGKVIETASEYLLRIPMNLRFVGLTVVLSGGFRYEFKDGIQDSNFVKLEMPVVGGGGSDIKVTDSLDSTSKYDALSANMGRELNSSKASNADLDKHKNDTNNPHNVTVDKIGAANKIHSHTIDDVVDLTKALDLKLNKSVWDENFVSSTNEITSKKTINVTGDVIVTGNTGTATQDGVEVYPLASGANYLWELNDVSDLVKEAPDGSMLVKQNGEWVYVDKIVINCGTYNIV